MGGEYDENRAVTIGDLKQFAGVISHSFTEINERFDRIDDKFLELKTEMGERFEIVDKRFEKMDQRFDRLEQRFAGYGNRLDVAEDRVLQLAKKTGTRFDK